MFADTAIQIINESIKSAIFIDENAREPFKEKQNPETLEDRLSVELFNDFEKVGISLSIHKFVPNDILNDKKKEFFFQDRDLVLLDWKLEKNDGEEYALKVGSKNSFF